MNLKLICEETPRLLGFLAFSRHFLPWCLTVRSHIFIVKVVLVLIKGMLML